MFKRIKGCFGSEQTNLGRQRELDVAKGLAIILMVFSHSCENLEAFFDPSTASSLGSLILEDIIGAFAPILMLSMGISLTYSRRESASAMAKRGLILLGTAYLLELARVVLPSALGYAFIGGTAEIVDYSLYVFVSDILQFASLSMLLMALFVRLGLGRRTILVISVVMSLVGWCFQGVSTGIFAVDVMLGFLWNTSDLAFFPILHWFAVIALGYAVGPAWKRVKDKDTFFKILTPISIAISAVYLGAMTATGRFYVFSGGDLYSAGTLEIVPLMAIAFSMIGIGYYVDKWASRPATFLASMGERITSIYCIHWTIYGFIRCSFFVLFLERGRYLTQWSLLFMPVIILVASDLLSRLYVRVRKRRGV